MRLLSFIKEETESVKDWNGYLNRIPMLASSIKILKNIEKNGYTAYIVGGAVRDIILGNDPHDIDIATNCPIEKLEKMYKIHDIGKSKDFGIVVVNQDGFTYEIAQYRSDSYVKIKGVRRIIQK